VLTEPPCPDQGRRVREDRPWLLIVLLTLAALGFLWLAQVMATSEFDPSNAVRSRVQPTPTLGWTVCPPVVIGIQVVARETPAPRRPLQIKGNRTHFAQDMDKTGRRP